MSYKDPSASYSPGFFFTSLFLYNMLRVEKGNVYTLFSKSKLGHLHLSLYMYAKLGHRVSGSPGILFKRLLPYK